MALFILVFFLLLVMYAIRVETYRKGWNRVHEFSSEAVPSVSVSIIIAVRNEEKNIVGLLESLEKLEYAGPVPEVIIVDDHSEDKTANLVHGYKATNFRLRVISLPTEETTKKRAIERGISEATGELILTTDADCRVPPEWVSRFAQCYQQFGARFIAAPVRMEPDGSLRSIFQCLDFLAMQGITGAAVNSDIHAMCNGANLGYAKESFEQVNGFAGIDAIPSGDDMLLMQKIRVRYPGRVSYLKSSDVIVSTPAERTWKEFLHQRIRWSSKSAHYGDKKLFFILLLTYLFNLCFLILGIISFFDIGWFFMLLLFLLAKVLIEYPFINAVAGFFGQRGLMKYFILFQPIHILYVIVAGWLGSFGSYRWKHRLVRNSVIPKAAGEG